MYLRKIYRVLWLLFVVISLLGCGKRFHQLTPHEQETSLLVQRFIEDLDIKKIQRTSKPPYMEMRSVEYGLTEEERKEFAQYISEKVIDWTDYEIRSVWKRKDCFDKKRCYIIFYPIFSIDGTKAIMAYQQDTKNGGFNKLFVYDKLHGEWQQSRMIDGMESWLYCR